MRRLAIIGYTTLFAATPAVATAADISGSYLTYTTDLKIRTSARYYGPSTGHARVCADQTGAVVGHGGSLAWVMHDISLAPDRSISGIVVEGGRPTSCGSLGATSTNQRYDTKVQASLDTKVQASLDSATGWAVARNS